MSRAASLSRLIRCIVAFASLGLLIWIHPDIVIAANPSGITISPSQSLVTLKPDQPTATYHIDLTNHAQQPVVLHMSTVDFEGVDETGDVEFVGQNPTQFTTNYGLSKWLALDQTQLSLDAGQTGTVVVTISNNQTLSPGGHYGAVVATVDASNQSGSVGVRPSIASLFFVNKLGGGDAKLTMQSIKPVRNWWGSVESSTTSFTNTGNVHVVPRGIIQVIDPANRVIAKGVVNANSSILLPGQQKSFEVPMLQLGLPWLPGTYRVASQYRTDTGQFLQTKIVKFNQIGLLVPLVIVLLLTAVISSWSIRRARRRLGEAV